MKKSLLTAAAAALSLILLAGPNSAQAKPREAKPAATAAPAASPVDLNSASQADLEKLPQVGAATAKKIIAGRPYGSVGDLSKVGVSKKTIEAITPLVTAGKAAAASAPVAAKASERPAKSAAAAAAGPVDLNTASQSELEKLPQVGAATAKKIIAGRPYASVQELARAGVSKKAIETITPLVTVSAAAAAATKSAPATAAAAAPAAPARNVPPPASSGTLLSPKAAETPVTAAVPPVKGMVWVNTSTKVFHREGDPWYGKTKHGKFMNEDEAIKAGFHLSKEKEPKKK